MPKHRKHWSPNEDFESKKESLMVSSAQFCDFQRNWQIFIFWLYCIWNTAVLYGSETWPTKIEDIRKIQRSEMRMLRWMTRVSLSERKSNEYVRSMLAIDDIGEVMRRNRLRWFGHVERRDELCWIKRIETLQVMVMEWKADPGRWREVLKEDMRKKGLCREDAWDRWRWRRMLW